MVILKVKIFYGLSCRFRNITRLNVTAVGGQRYDLARPLAVGDIIEAWGIYKDITTVKFKYVPLC